MNRYLIPYCKIEDSKVGNHIIAARSLNECKEKLMKIYENYSDSDNWNQFIKELDDQDVLIGEIKDIELI